MRNILRYIKKLALRKIAFFAILLIIVIIVMIIIPFKKVISPQTVSNYESLITAYLDGKNNIRIENLEINYTGIDITDAEEGSEEETGEAEEAETEEAEETEVLAAYYYVKVEDVEYEDSETDAYIFFLIPYDETEELSDTIKWSGKAKMISGLTEEDELITAYLENSRASAEDLLAEPGGFLVSGYDYSARAMIITLLIFIIVLILLIIALVKTLIVYFKPLRSKTFKRLEKFGEGPESAGAIKTQLRDENTRKFGNIFITKEYFIGYTNFDVIVVPLDNIMRAVRPAGKKICVIIDTEPKAKYKVKCAGRKQADGVVEAIRSIF